MLGRSAYTELVEAIPRALPLTSNPLGIALPSLTATSTSSLTPTLSRDNFPHVRWWHESSWTQTKDVTDPEESDDEGDSLDPSNTKTKKAVAYLEDKQGTPISEERRKAIYKHARGIWSLLARTTQLPTGYQNADVVVLTHYRNEMEAKFPELQLCSEHWKADRVWIKNFSSWRKSYMKQQAKLEMKKEEADRSSKGADQKKRTHAQTGDDSKPPNKKTKRSQKDSKVDDADVVTGTQVVGSSTPDQAQRPVIPQAVDTEIVPSLDTTPVTVIVSISESVS
jgi:hypothetical protein